SRQSSELRIEQLENELQQLREDMRSITEDQEASNEELQSANEELLSGSEELQSLNEELETSKEELQSTNEELTVVNQEMIGLNEQISTARNYAESIVANIREPLLVLDKSLRIKTANKSFYKTFRVNEHETEGILIYDLGNKQWNIPALRMLLENILPEKSVFNDFEVTHTFSTIGERVMLLNAREVINKSNSEKLILLSIEDITERKQLELKEHLLLGRFQNLIMQTPTPICVFRGEDMILEIANEPIFNMWKVGKEALGKAYLEIKPEMKDQPFIGYLREVFHTGVTHYGNEQPAFFIRENGEKENYYFNFIYQPYREIDGTISGVIVMAFDVTQEVILKIKIEESEKQFRQMAELMPQKVWTADAKGSRNYSNQKMLDYSGLSFEELQGWGWQKMIHPDDLERTKKLWQASIDTGNDYEIENRYRRNDGTYLWHLVRATAVKDENGKIKIWIGSKTEIQEQREQKEALEKAVKRRTNQLEKANEELLKMNTELEAFAYVSSHDLQEPLRKIQTFGSRILEKEKENLSDKGKDYFQRMQVTAHRMQTLIEDLLTYSRTNATERKFKSTDLNIIIEQVKADLKDSLEEKHATIEATELCPANIIPFQFRQLMHNIIGNALKFSNPKHPPHIIIKSTIAEGSKLNTRNLSPEKNYCHISITDNGIGFEKEYSEKIFEVFQKLHSKDQYAGTGIGLAIVKKIVDNHHGIITATSALNKGTTFDIYIPE
ncbi:MAG: PAS domain S-box protein, partial [Bacteroidia bacterium]|nr:PAS domain S-box protein [Bacteroidia bacterium]